MQTRLRDWTLESIAGLELQCDTSAISDQTCNHLISKVSGWIVSWWIIENKWGCIVKLKLVECTNLISNYPTLIRIYCCIISNFNFSEHKSVQSWIFNLALTPCQSFQFAKDYASVEKFSNKKKNVNNNIFQSPGAEDHHQHQDHRRRKQQQPVNDDASYQRTSPCTDHDCQHGVCIATGGGNNYKCQCDQGYTGNLSYNINIHTWLTHNAILNHRRSRIQRIFRRSILTNHSSFEVFC